jgi:uncharacterized protein YigE (DUF2233 family)
MMRGLLPFVWIAMLAACEQQPAGEPVVRTELGEDDSGTSASPIPEAPETVPSEEPQRVSACKAATFEETRLTHCIANPETHAIRTALAPEDGQPYGSLAALADTIDAQGVAFAVTGGAFGDDLRALGYYVEEGERLSELERGEGDGNFYMKPNGVFFGGAGNWRVLSTERFFATVRDRPQFGTQSGPMLVIGGALHPEFDDDGPSRTVRGGVGIDAEGRAHFVISDEPVSFGRFARFYRDVVEADEALLLASGNAALWDPATGRLDEGRAGPILVVGTGG